MEMEIRVAAVCMRSRRNKMYASHANQKKERYRPRYVGEPCYQDPEEERNKQANVH